MRECKCTQCGGRFFEDDSNPNIHYSEPAKICNHCIHINRAPTGTWLQRADGSYYQK